MSVEHKTFAADGVTPTFELDGVGIVVPASAFNKLVFDYTILQAAPASPSAAAVPDIAAAVLAERNACSDLCNDMADWPLAKIPSANPEGGSDYRLGVMRGLVTAANAIRQRAALHGIPSPIRRAPQSRRVGPRGIAIGLWLVAGLMIGMALIRW